MNVAPVDEVAAKVPHEWHSESGICIAPYFQRAVTLQPAFFRGEYVQELAPHLQDEVSPEKTIRGLVKHVPPDEARAVQAINERYGFGSLELDSEATIPRFENIGRRWRVVRGFTKDKGGIASTWATPRENKTTRRKYRKLVAEVAAEEVRRIARRISRVLPVKARRK